ncbi:MAG: winged helix-turn-helix domain-containing protein [Anaerolineales bacterium]|nr:winged helix-turn-helix domain-containing protein [Anaerolineales bacterium]
MPQERLPVRKIKAGLRLHHEAGISNRAIARACSLSNSTVGEYLARAEQLGWAELAAAGVCASSMSSTTWWPPTDVPARLDSVSLTWHTCRPTSCPA